MKLLRMRLKNLNSFKREVELNFEEKPLNEAPLLAITGPTGSGKTTLLDALCVALYNKTPRLGGTGNRNVVNLISQGANEGFSEVLFEVNRTRYLSEWTVKRNRKGDLKPSGKLIYADTGGLITDRLSSKRNAEELSDMSVEGATSKILGMDFNAFNRSVMLAQGEFAAFLKAEPEKKREILEVTTGMDLYEKLKEVLNDRVKTVEAVYSQAESELNAVPPASKEEIDSTQELLKELDKELEQLNGEKRKVGEIKELETQRARMHDQLLDAEKNQRKLLSQKDEIDRLEDEIERARRAADIRSERDVFEREKTNVGKSETALQNAQRTLEKSIEEYEGSQRNFSKADEDFKKARDDSKEKFEAIDAAREEEIQAQNQFAEAEERQKEIEKSEKTLVGLEKSIKAKSDQKKLLEVQIEKDEVFLREHPLPENSEKLFADASGTLGTLNGMKKSLGEKARAQKEKKATIDELREKLHSLQEERQTLAETKVEVEESLRKTEDKLNSLLEEGDESDWVLRKDDAQRVQEYAVSCEDAIKRLQEEKEEEQKNREHLETVENKLDAIATKLEIKAKEVERAEESVKRYEAEREYALISNQVVLLRTEHLKDGEPCPVCGAIEHPWADKVAADGLRPEESEQEKLIEEARANLANAQKELRRLQRDKSELEREQSSQEANKIKLGRDLQKAQGEIERLNAQIENAQQQWRQVYPKEEISSKLLRAKIKESDKYLRDINSADKAKTDAQNNLNLLIQNLKGNQKEIDSADNQLSGIEGERKTLTGEIESLTREIAQTEERFWESLPEEFQAENPEYGLKKFEGRISTVKQCRERLEKNRRTLDVLKTSIDENEKTLAGDKVRLEEIKTQANQYRQRGKQLLDSARAKTGGQTADEARNSLNAELQNKEKKRNELQEDLQGKKIQRAEAQISLSDAEREYEENIANFSAAEEKYIEELKQAGFASPEEHQKAFKEPEWIEEKNQTVEDHRKDVHSIEQQIENLQKTFAEKPFVPEELVGIQNKEREIDSAITAKNKQVGESNQKINQLRENLKLREERGAKLEKARKERDRWVNLSNCMSRNELRDFALKSMFDLMIRFANKQLDDLTHRYMLKVKDMRDMVVVDRWNAGEERPVETLSGGESFLTSLSLALALSELSKGRTQLDSLFLDEGFGTLDSETLDIALSALEGLQLSGTNIVVISHIGELTRRIPVRIAVSKMGDGSSRVEIEG